jgi:hypothetical protein
MKIKCFSCTLVYDPVNKNIYRTLKDEILVGRYGQDNYGKNIDYIACTLCGSFHLVQISIIKYITSLIGVTAPYIIKSKSLSLKDVRNKVNEIFDNTSRELEEILEFDCAIPPHVIKFIEKSGLLSIDKFGLKFKNRYIDLHTSYPRSEEQMIRDDIILRLDNIEKQIVFKKFGGRPDPESVRVCFSHR